jgi:hypothetical protein
MLKMVLVRILAGMQTVLKYFLYFLVPGGTWLKMGHSRASHTFLVTYCSFHNVTCNLCTACAIYQAVCDNTLE